MCPEGEIEEVGNGMDLHLANAGFFGLCLFILFRPHQDGLMNLICRHLEVCVCWGGGWGGGCQLFCNALQGLLCVWHQEYLFGFVRVLLCAI